MGILSQQKTGKSQIKIRDEKGKPSVATLYNAIFNPDSCNRLFSIITLMNLGHTSLFHKGFYIGFFSANEQNAAKSPHSAQRKHELLIKIK